MCEEFGCLPSEALQEDVETVFEIMSLRRYAEAKVAVEAKGSDEENTTPWQREVVFDVVEEIGKLGKG